MSMIRAVGIAKRSFFSFGLLGAVTLLLGLFAVMQLSILKDDIDVISQQWLPAVAKTGEMQRDFLSLRISASDIFNRNDNDSIARISADISQWSEKLRAAEQQLQHFMVTDDAKRLFTSVIELRENYIAAVHQIVTLIQQGSVDDAIQLRSQDVQPISARLVTALNELSAHQIAQASAASSQALNVFAKARTALVVGAGVALAIVLVLAWLFSRSLITPLREAVDVARTISSGNLTLEFSDDGHDEAADMIAALKQMQHKLRDAMHTIGDSSSQLATTSEELSVVTGQSTQITTEQSDQLQQAASAVNELTVAIDDVARSAATTSDNSNLVNEKTAQGQHKVNLTIQTIEALVEGIKQSSTGISQLAQRVKDIGSVMDVIRGVAEQTNLLALNAAIEAARAGEQGRGFAVVADEVRALAYRTQESTSEIETMIKSVETETANAVNNMSQSNLRAVETLTVANEAGQALTEIASLINDISQQNLTIAAAAEEQATVARTVDSSLVSIRDLSVQTAAGSQQTSASSAELARLAEKLNELISHFKY
ncbi:MULTISPECIES: methyl-accepting chemotaxis protein [Shewanella]|uniref:methyl-accepting chemotaxis protein n=1 Tax=Shewanella TaxID=22 RepID=UPI001671C8E9|nr:MULTISPECIES: methyl-accepting chemotaxis protein [Shewanella]MBO1272134.1 methyl-accepting chemotaxis protein [Shewanella sp. 4t3-1-2LB]MCL2907992.1 methyl-accepting chemotaxis protein [Shewanella fodinae]GGZ12840.1 methyl-accepting chemotaxis protein [Shewanella fodinae]